MRTLKQVFSNGRWALILALGLLLASPCAAQVVLPGVYNAQGASDVLIITQPANNPGAGYLRLWADSSTNTLCILTSAGVSTCFGSGGGGGSVTSVNGTSGQIAAANPTSTPVLSFTSPATFPGNVILASPTTLAPSLHFPCATGPTSPATGDTWCTTTTLTIQGLTIAAADIPPIDLASSSNGGVTGTIVAANFPALTGDVTNTAGSLVTAVGQVNGGALPASAAVVGTNSSSQVIATPSQTAKFFFAAPNGSAGAPTFRAIVASDVPTLNQNTTGSAATVTGLSVVSGKTLTVDNSITVAGTDSTTMTFPATNATIARTDAAQTFLGAQSFINTGAQTFLTIGDNSAGTFPTVQLKTGSGFYNWIVSAQNHATNSIEFTPSTATGGTTYTTPAFTFSQGGNLTAATFTGALAGNATTATNLNAYPALCSTGQFSSGYTTGSPPSNNCATPTGSGTVNTGTAAHLAYYATSTTAVSDMGTDFTFATHTLTGGASSILDLSTNAGALLKLGLIEPASDAVTAVVVKNAAGATNILDVDTTNTRVGILNAAPAYALDVGGTAQASVLRTSSSALGGVVIGATNNTTAPSGATNEVIYTGINNLPCAVVSTPTTTCTALALGPGASTANHLAKFANTDGQTLADGGAIPAGTVTSVTFAGDGTVESSTLSSAVTTSGSVTATLANAPADTALVNPGTSAAAPIYTASLPCGPLDTQCISVDEEFFGGIVGTTAVASRPWFATTVVATGCTTTFAAGAAPNLGILQLVTPAVSTDGCGFALGASAEFGALTPASSPFAWTSTWIFKSPASIASNNASYRIGFTNSGSSSAVPTNGIYVRYDSNLGTPDTTFKFVVCNACGGTETVVSDSAVTAAASTWYKVTMTDVVAGVATAAEVVYNLYSASGALLAGPISICGSGCTTTGTPPTVALTAGVTTVTGTSGAQQTLQLDKFSFRATGLAR